MYYTTYFVFLLHYTDFIMPIAAQLSDVVHGPLVGVKEKKGETFYNNYDKKNCLRNKNYNR